MNDKFWGDLMMQEDLKKRNNSEIKLYFNEKGLALIKELFKIVRKNEMEIKNNSIRNTSKQEEKT